MRAIQTHLLTPSNMPASSTEKLHIYNGLDCMVTMEVFEVLDPQLDNATRATYEHSKSLQGPVLDMSMRGVRIDIDERTKVLTTYFADLRRIERALNRILVEGVGYPCNWNSPAQLKKLFYEVLGLPTITKRRGSDYGPTVDRNALEKLTAYFLAKPIVSHILALRDIAKKISTLRTEVDSDNRMRTSYNIAGTNTGRFSSSSSILGTGGNFQNWEERLRRIFIADPGFKLAYIDLEQAESRLVGAIEWNLFGDGTYLDACESGDLHTAVARLAWPTLSWTGDKLADKLVAELPFYRQHSYRHMAKVLGHGTNYNGQPFTMHQHTKIPIPAIEQFQSAYFKAFPAHQRWHAHVANQVRQDGYMINLMGRKRWFFGRRDDPTTVREAIAFDPQGSVGDILNIGMRQVWETNLCQLLMQVHDAILIQYPEEDEAAVLHALTDRILVYVPLRNGRTLVIPCDVKSGWNFASWSEANPDGLRKWRGADERKRTAASARKSPASILDIVI